MTIPGRIRAFVAAAALAGCAVDARCPASQNACESPSDAGYLCADWQSEWSHCGACFRHCAVGQQCVRGRCETLVCHPHSSDCINLQTRRECDGQGRNFATYSCARGTVCAAGRCREWPEPEAWTLVERDTFERAPELPDWLIVARTCGAASVLTAPNRRMLQFTGPVYARRVLRFTASSPTLAANSARAVSVRFRAVGAGEAELALLASPGSARAGVAGCIRARVIDGRLRIALTNGSVVSEQPADESSVTIRVEIDEARRRVRVLIDGVVRQELGLADFPLLGSYLQVNSDTPCNTPTFEIEEVQTWSAP